MYYSERLNAYSHLIGLFAVIVLGTILVVGSSLLADTYKIVANSIFTASMIFLYFSSTLYHSIKKIAVKNIFQKMDHVAIYILIAGTYTPFMLISIRGGWGWSILGVIWGLALLGMIQELVLKDRKGSRIISLIIYLVMGWIGFIAVKPIWEALSTVSFIFLVLGGLLYTMGVYWYVNDEKIKHGHGIWHIFVLLGTLSHIISIYNITF